MSFCSLTDWRDGLASGDLSSEFLALRCLERIERWDPQLNAIIYRNPEQSLQIASEADQRLRRGERGPLMGVPVVIKDNMNWKGHPTTHGSRISQGYCSPYHATVIQRLLDAGAVPIAKANMDEFAMGSSGEHSAFGPSRNPWDPARVPGGSSSGSAVAVAAGYTPLALGTDTGGSVRLPASFCNISALRPTYGVLSRYGITAMANSLDQVGPMASDVRGLACGLSVMAGLDPADATSRDLPGQERLADLKPRSWKGVRVGLPKDYFTDAIHPGVRQVLGTAIRQLASEGAEMVDVSLPSTPYAIETYYLICTSEVSSNMSRFDGIRYGNRKDMKHLQDMISETRDQGFGPEVKRRILLGAFCLSKGYYEAYYEKALKARTLIARDFAAAFRQADVLLTPVSPTVAFPLDSKTQDPMAMYLADVYAVASALAGLPSLALPAGFAAPDDAPQTALPVGMQLIGPACSDVDLLEWGHAFQQLTDHHRRTPSLDQ